MDFGFAIIIDFAMNTDKMNLAYLVGKVMDEIINFQILLTFRKLYQKVIIRIWHIISVVIKQHLLLSKCSLILSESCFA